MPTDSRPSRIVRSFVDSLGVMTAPLAGRIAFKGDPRPARLLLAQLSTAGVLHRHLCRHSASPHRFVYYTGHPEPLPLGRLRELFAVAEFFADPPLGASLLSREDLAALFAPVAQAAKVAPPPFAPCYLRVPDGAAEPRLSLVWPARAKDMNKAVADLATFTAHPEFATWRAFAANGQFEITCLYRSYRRSPELQRWLHRRPLLCRVGGPAVTIPVLVLPAAMLR